MTILSPYTAFAMWPVFISKPLINYMIFLDYRFVRNSGMILQPNMSIAKNYNIEYGYICKLVGLRRNATMVVLRFLETEHNKIIRISKCSSGCVNESVCIRV